MLKRLVSGAVAMAIAAGFALPGAFAQGVPAPAGGTTAGPGPVSTGGAGGTTAGPKGESDLPIDAPPPAPPVEDQKPPPPPVEDTPPKIYDESLPTKTQSLIYVLDRSGSMSWDDMAYTGVDGSQQTGPRIDRAKAELTKSIMALSPNFHFEVMAYDCDLMVIPQGMQKADPGPKATAIAWVNGIQPGGGTGTGPAVVAALNDKTNYEVVLLSDGAPNCPFDYPAIPQHLQMIISGNTQHAVIDCFGIDCHGEFEQFMRDVAASSGGRYFPVP